MLKNVFPRRLRLARELRGLTQGHLADAAGLSAATVCLLESGLAQDLKVSTLLRICAALSVSADYLLVQEGVRAVVTVAAPSWCEGAGGCFLVLPGGTDSRRCPVCELVLPRGEPHTHGRCILEASDRGRPAEHLALVHGFTPAAIRAILAEERRLRRARPDPIVPSGEELAALA